MTSSEATAPAPAGQLRATLRLLLGLHLLSMTGRGVFFTVSALYFTQVVGLDVQGVGLALTTAAGAGVAASFTMGLLADRLAART